MSMTYSSNAEYRRQEAMTNAAYKKETDRRADLIYRKALALKVEIEAFIIDHMSYIEREDLDDLMNLAEVIDNAVSLETRERAGIDG